eukprot:scaffold251471_cov35-Prasinocladus_malaysianus.AAC.1
MLVLNSLRALSMLGRIGDQTFPWVLGMVWLLWWGMTSMKALCFIQAGGLRDSLFAFMKDMQKASVYFTVEDHLT